MSGIDTTLYWRGKYLGTSQDVGANTAHAIFAGEMVNTEASSL